MQAGVFHGERDIRVEQVPDARIEHPTDAVVRIVRSSVCGSDLWSYRGISPGTPGSRTGHEFTGIVEAVGDDVRDVSPGDLVIAPFAYGDGECEYCRAGLWTSCVQGGFFGVGINGGQAEYARVPWADANLWVAPTDTPEERWDALHLLTDVLLTGWHAGVMARVGQVGMDGQSRVDTAIVIGDGAVGLSGVIAARAQGADTVIAVGHHDDRLEIARQLGATETVNLRGKELTARLLELTDGGAPAVLECVGVTASLQDAVRACRPGGVVGMVGVPHTSDVPLGHAFQKNLRLAAGVAPTNAYVAEVGPLVASGELDPSPIASDVFGLDELPDAFAAMDERRTIKAILHPHG